MEIDLQSVGDMDLTQSERAIFNVLKATLQYPARPQAKIGKIAEDIHFCCTSQEEDAHVGLWVVWSVVIDIVCFIPSGHSWQDSLIQSLERLRRRDDAVPQHNKSIEWKDLPNLSYCVREKWSDPAYTGEDVGEEFAKWKNLNSFVARLTSTGFAPWLNLPIWQLRMALEESPVKGPAMECRMWVASEWIIHCAYPIFQDLTSELTEEKLDEDMLRSLRTGALCDDIPPLSLERWEYWKKRFSELATDAGSLGLDSAIVIRISDAVKIMKAVNEQAN